MSVSGVSGLEQPPVVYLSPQAISPLSASKEPIALALAARPQPDPVDKAAVTNASKTLTDKAVEKVQGSRRTPAIPDSTTGGQSFAGKVDFYV
jgi:hypothetical protein